MKSLVGKVAVVAGGTRGCGRAIAVTLGEAGATVYVTGRSTKGSPSDIGRLETIEETAELVNKRGGVGIPVRVDHSNPEEVKALFERVGHEQNGQLDILINDIWGGDHLTDWGKPMWEHSLENGILMQQRAIYTHIHTSYYGLPLMVKNGRGLLVEITDGVGYWYRGSFFYSLAKISVCHMAQALAEELRPHGITAVAVSPGFLRSEQMLDHFGVTEQNWRDATAQEPHFIESETPYYVAKGIAALAADPNVAARSGQMLTSWYLADEYGISDVDGRSPHWGNYARAQDIYKHLSAEEQQLMLSGPRRL